MFILKSISRPAAAAMFSLLLSAGAARAQEEDFSKATVKVLPVAGSVYLLEGVGGNIAASVGEDGIVLVDDEFAPLAEKIAAALKGIGVTDKPVRYVINTHYHGDHTGGNLPLASGGSTLIAQTHVRERLERGGEGGNGGAIKFDNKPAEKLALPVITFDHDMTVHLNGEDIRALHYPSGHTDGDSIIFFPKANVVHMGDDYVRYGFPFIDVAGGGSIDGMIEACESVIATLPADVKVIPGHGELSNLGEMREYVAMLKATRSAVAKAIKSGMSLQRMKERKILAAFDAKYSGDFVNTDAFIETLYNSLRGRKSGAFIRHN